MHILDLPPDAIEAIHSHMDARTLRATSLVCQEWNSYSKSESVISRLVASVGTISRSRLCRLLGLSASQTVCLPQRPYITRKGQARFVFGPEAIPEGVKMRSGKRRRSHTLAFDAQPLESARAALGKTS